MAQRRKTRSGDIGFTALDVAGLILIIGLLTFALRAITAARGW